MISPMEGGTLLHATQPSRPFKNRHLLPFLQFPFFISTPHKRPIMNQSSSVSDSQTLTSFHSSNSSSLTTKSSSSLANPAFRILRHLIHLLLLLLLLSLPSFYFFLSNPHHSFLLVFLYAIAFSAALLLSLNLALSRLPSIRLLLRRSFPLNPASSPSLLPFFRSFKSSSSLANTAFRILRLLSLKLPCSSTSSSSPRHPSTPVLWSIGSWLKSDKQAVSGSCVRVYRNGGVYEGEFQHGKWSGSGVYYHYMSERCEGDWVDNKFDGYGVHTWADGSRYRGQYRKGSRHGFGMCSFNSGDVYAGEWFNGKKHGCGVHTGKDGSQYVGEFKWGVAHGLMHSHFSNGNTYAGEYFANKIQGFGVYCFANGCRYEGAWHEGRRQGLGMYTFRNGETQSGHWQNGVLDASSTQNTHTGFPVAVNHSKVLDAVQEARRAAEKAFDVASVDERVNNAVTMANKAANNARVAALIAVQKRTDNNNEDDIPIPIV